MQNPRLDAALAYAAAGWPVVLLAPGSKTPATGHGVKDATTDPDTIHRWFEAEPTANLGIACGEASGIVVIDIDPRNGGDVSWEELTREHGLPADGWPARTAGLGEHWFFRWQEGIRSKKLAPGIDLLSDGRYAVVDPSMINGSSYSWLDVEEHGTEPGQMPACWAALCQTPKPKGESIVPGSIVEGGRNEGLASLAGVMRQHGMTEAEILAALHIANDTRCKPPLPGSEVSRIAGSVSKYDPEWDTAADAALGAQAALALREPEPETDFELVDLSTLNEPAPPRWLVKGWFPEAGLAMVHGPSGAGKSFALLDICCHIASGSSWWGRITKAGPVVFLCGEGHYGMRSRHRAWTIHHHRQFSGLWLSPYAVPLDRQAGASKAIQAIERLGVEPSLIVIDTLHRHMEGDENKAQDSAKLIASCEIMQRAFGSLVVLVHHTGNSEEAQHRARGSSAWKGALDAEFSVLPRKKATGYQLICRKQKDSPEPEKMIFSLQSVPIGWLDEDGEEVSGAVPVLESVGDGTPEEDTPNKAEESVILAIQSMGGQCSAKRDPSFLEAFLQVYGETPTRRAAMMAKTRAVQSLLASSALSQNGESILLAPNHPAVCLVQSKNSLLK